jgi:hypothetical protein
MHAKLSSFEYYSMLFWPDWSKNSFLDPAICSEAPANMYHFATGNTKAREHIKQKVRSENLFASSSAFNSEMKF